MDFTKVDFSKFDAAKLFDADKMLAEVEKNTKTAIGYITDAKAKAAAKIRVVDLRMLILRTR